MIEIVFLGTGSGIPTPERNHAAIWLRHEGEAMLWDCGEGTQRQILKAKLNFMKVNNIFITHWHADHWVGLIGLLLSMNLEERRKPLYVYGPEAERFVGDILDLGYWGTKFPVVPKSVPYEGSKITKLLKNKDYEISSIPVDHSVPSVAYSIKENDKWNVDIKKSAKLYGIKQGPLVGKLKKNKEITHHGKKITLKDVGVMKKGLKITYSGDTRHCDNTIKLAKDSDILIHDSTFVEEMDEGMHSSVKDATDIAKEAKAKKLILTHYSRRYRNIADIEKEAKRMFKNTFAAKDFQSIIVK